jgi:Leucine-rich repeat (LRR) protein
MQNSPKSWKNQENPSKERSIQIQAVALTTENYVDYRDLIPSMNNLQTLESHKQPGITEIPCGLPDSLKEINIIETGLREIRALPRWLEYLYCQKNKIEFLPDRMPRNLRILNCSDNQLTRLPQLPQTIKILYCFGNPLTSVPTWFPDSLSMLDIAGCGITELPARLPKSLTKLKCNNNQLTRLPKVLPSELNSLDCSHNKLVELPLLPEKLLVIDAENNQLSIFDFTGVRTNMSIRLGDNIGLPDYRRPLTFRANIEYNIELTRQTIWLRRMQVMKDALLANSHRICYLPSRVERLITSGDIDITALADDL